MTTFHQRSFATGEISPALYSRADLEKFSSAAKLLRNYYIRRDGAAENRPGTKFVCEIKNSLETERLLPFEFSSDQTYVMEFSNLSMRLCKLGGQVLEAAKTITGVTLGATTVVAIIGNGYSIGDEITISGIVGTTELNGRNWKVTNVLANSVEVRYLDNSPVDSTAFGAYVSGGEARRVYDLVTTYDDDEVQAIYPAQSADVLTLAVNTQKPREIQRSAETSWSVADITIAPTISAPTGASVSPAGSFASYAITAVQDETFEESLKSSTATGGTAEPTPSGPNTITWNKVDGARYYRVYRRINGVYSFLDIANLVSGTTVTFRDIGDPPDSSDTPPDNRNPFSTAGNYPSVAGLVGQRRLFANTSSDNEKIEGSRIGQPRNFTIATPRKDSDAVTFRISGEKVNPVFHIVNAKGMAVLTREGEFTIGARDSGVITPDSIPQEQVSYNGTCEIIPLRVGDRILYVQTNKKQIFDFGFDQLGNLDSAGDLTALANHLFDDYEIVRWAYQKTPHPVVWVVRSDGKVLSLTFLRAQQIFAWTQHEFPGATAEDVVAIPEEGQHYVYFLMKREVDGREVRYIERLNTRQITDEKEMIFMDCAITYDGRNPDETVTMIVTGGTTWAAGEYLTLTCSDVSYFSSDDVGNEIHIYGDSTIRFNIQEYVSGATVKGKADIAIPSAMRSVEFSEWAYAVDEVGNLWHIEGKDVSILGDGAVVKSPNNPSYDPVVTVADGTISLERFYGVIHVGLPYMCDLQTLALETVRSETWVDKKKSIPGVSIRVDKSRGGFVGVNEPQSGGNARLDLYEFIPRSNEDYGTTPTLRTGVIQQDIQRDWTDDGNVFLRQIDPLPMTVVSIAPAVTIATGGKD